MKLNYGRLRQINCLFFCSPKIDKFVVKRYPWYLKYAYHNMGKYFCGSLLAFNYL